MNALEPKTIETQWGSLPINALVSESFFQFPGTLAGPFRNSPVYPTTLQPRKKSANIYELGLVIEEQLKEQIQESASFTPLLKDIEAFYVFSSNSEIKEFLKRHRVLPALLIEARTFLTNCFGEQVFSLQVQADDFESDILYCVILWPGALIDAKEALSQFDNQWWMERSPQATGQLTFIYELV